MSVVSPARSYDYIIVGAGSSGCALAHRLTEDAGVRLLLLEAGGWDRDPWLKIPLALGSYPAAPNVRLDVFRRAGSRIRSVPYGPIPCAS